MVVMVRTTVDGQPQNNNGTIRDELGVVKIPVSDAEGKEWSKQRILNLPEVSVVYDFGAGSGTYSDLLRKDMPNTFFKAIEIFEPYVDTYDLKSKYDSVQVADARETDMIGSEYTVAIFGDIIEHMHESEARALIARAKAVHGHILVSLPIVHSPQGEVNGNVYETHHKDWSFLEMHKLMDFCEAYEGNTLGVFWWSKNSKEYLDVEDPCWCGCDDNYLNEWD